MNKLRWKDQEHLAIESEITDSFTHLEDMNISQEAELKYPGI